MYDNSYNKYEKVFFSAGDVVTIKHDLTDKPTMLVQKIDKVTMKSADNKSSLLGVTCIWFSKDLKLQTHRFSTKDLEKIQATE